MSQGRLYFILLLRPYRDLSIRTMYLFADIIQGKFLRENRDYLGFICEMVEYSHWKLRYIVIKHSVMQTLLPIWRFLFVVLHKLTFSQESRSAHLWILIHLKPESVISWQFYDVSFFGFFINITYSAKKFRSWIRSLFSPSSYTMYSYTTWKSAPNGNKQYTTHIKSWFFFNDLLANQILFWCQLLTGYWNHYGMKTFVFCKCDFSIWNTP